MLPAARVCPEAVIWVAQQSLEINYQVHPGHERKTMSDVNLRVRLLNIITGYSLHCPELMARLVGKKQTYPTIRILYEREREIEIFVPRWKNS
ncbi:hypothetical protein PUN28_000173 [Cardiocondyla obscurior]|uniref:Uncharacterized protein n=1 Tax=Cardiocondyla obscurior TaxID=286306 RepID=A0AAW2GY44_9HYME